MAKGRDKRTRRLQIDESIANFIKANPILIASLLRYDGNQTFSDPNDIPSLGYISNLGVGQVVDFQFSGTDVNDPTGNPNLALALTGTQRPFSVTVNGTLISGFSWDLTSNDIYGLSKPDGTAWDSYDVIQIGVFGMPSAPISTPVITTQPQSKTITRGHTMTLNVVATNASSYQWYFNASPITGATSNTLVVNDFQSANAGNYTVQAFNSDGSVTSNIALATYDAGIQLINFSAYTRAFASNGLGRNITLIDGDYTATYASGYDAYVRTTATSIILRQNGTDSLTFSNTADSTQYRTILVGNVDNTFNAPFADLVVFNDNSSIPPPPAPTNGIVDTTNHTFTFTESI